MKIDELRSIICSRCGSRTATVKGLENLYCECGGSYKWDDDYLDSLNINPKIGKRIDLESEFNNELPNYQKLLDIIRGDLKSYLKNKIKYNKISGRIKHFPNFYEKIERKQYSEPFGQMEDICGIRIICYYQSDLEIISKIIQDEYKILKSVDKSDLLQFDEFGYRSLHFIVQIRDDKLKISRYKNLENLKAEIQVRTVLMDAHASIEHELTYKKGLYIPYKYRRKLSQLSAILETVEDEFQYLKEDMDSYWNNLVKLKEIIEFDFDRELSLDTLQDFLDFYFPDREKIPAAIEDLFNHIQGYNNANVNDKISLKVLADSYLEVEIDLYNLERKHFAYMETHHKWHQARILEEILYLTHKKYLNFFAA